LLGQGYKLALRPHPRYGSLDTKWLAENAIAYSDPIAESSFDFINNIDLLISNESSIHLDAAMMQCPSVLYNFSTHPILDHYSYIKSGLLKVADSEAKLIDLVRDPKALLPAIETLQFYNASCGTQLEGHLGEAIATFIRAIVASNPIRHENQDFPFSISAAAFDCV
jgi:hypothetical protein